MTQSADDVCQCTSQAPAKTYYCIAWCLSVNTPNTAISVKSIHKDTLQTGTKQNPNPVVLLQYFTCFNLSPFTWLGVQQKVQKSSLIFKMLQVQGAHKRWRSDTLRRSASVKSRWILHPELLLCLNQQQSRRLELILLLKLINIGEWSVPAVSVMILEK